MTAVRHAFLIGSLLAVTFAGCLGGDDANPTPTPGPAGPYTTFACADGTTHPATPNEADRCNVRITGNPPRNNGPANELTIAVDPKNPLRLVAGAKDYTLGAYKDCGKYRVWSGYYWSDDGGFTWGNNLMPGFDQPASGQSQSATNGYHCISDPVVYWDNNGNAYYSGLSYNLQRVDAPPPAPVGGGTSSNLYLAKSTDGGKTYGPARVVAQGNDDYGFLHDKQWFTIDYKTGNIYFTWSAFLSQPATVPANPTKPTTDPVLGTDQLLFSRSRDGGTTWDPPVILYESGQRSAVPQAELEKQFSMPQVDKDGTIYVTWRTDATKSIWLTMSTNQGATWTAARPIVEDILMPCPPAVQCPPKNSNFRVDTAPVLAVDRSNGPNAGHLYVVYAANATQAENLEVYLVKSADKGQSWSKPARVNDDNTTHDQFLPWVEVGSLGDVHIVFYDRRYDPENRLLDLTYVHSKDGIKFDPNLRVTEVSSDAKFSLHQVGREFMGDYIGVTEGSDGRVHPIWVDTRDGRADAYTTAIAR